MNEDRVVSALRGLDGRSELEAVLKHHAVVVVTRRDQHAGYFVPGLMLWSGE